MAEKTVVWVIDGEQWPRACVCAELIERGLDAQGFEEIPQALAAFHDRKTPRPAVMILELRNQQLSKIMLDNLEYTGIPVIALSGLFEIPKAALEFHWAQTLRRPVSIGQICDAVEKFLQKS